MATLSFTGTHSDFDGTFPDNTSVKIDLFTPFVAVGAVQINRTQISGSIDNDTGALALDVEVPDDGSSIEGKVTLPDGQHFYALFSTTTPTAWVDFIAAENDGATYEPSALAGYWPLSGGTGTGQMQFSGTTHYGIKLISLTTAQRDALTPTVGVMIYNSTTGNIEGYDGSSWNDLGGAGGGASELSDLSDVGVTTPTDKNALMADGDSWESRSIVEADVSDLDHDDLAAYHDNVSGEINATTGKATPVDADIVLGEDSADTYSKIKVTWANVKATLKTYFDTLYAAVSHTHVAGDVDSGAAADGTVLTADGAGNSDWEAAAGGGSPGGNDTEMQFNNGGAFGGAPSLTYDNANNRVSVVRGDSSPDGLVLKNTGASDSPRIYIIRNNEASGNVIRRSANGLHLGYSGTPGVSSGSVAMTIADNGTVGIPTAVFNTQFAVTSAFEVTFRLDGSHVNTSRIFLNATNAAADTAISFARAGSTKWYIGVDNSDSDKFKIGPSFGFVSTLGLELNRTTGTFTINNKIEADDNATAGNTRLQVWDVDNATLERVKRDSTTNALHIGTYTPDTNEYIVIACSDETSDLATATPAVTFRMPYAFTLSEVRASVGTAATGSAIQVDINETGSTILSTKITIDATEKTSETAATPPVISDSALADDAEITIDIDAVGSTLTGAGLKVYLIGSR